MKKALLLAAIVIFVSCNNKRSPMDSSEKIITVSIAPYKYFVDSIGGGDFSVNVMVPPGSDPHIYEPVPGQITKLRESSGYISNGFLGFEMTWLDRLYETNPSMKKLNLGKSVDPIDPVHEHADEHLEGADPHYWVSPKCALEMATAIRQFLGELNPAGSEKYDKNFNRIAVRIAELDKRAIQYFSPFRGRAFMIYHPNLAYLARDYGLEEIAVESGGKEPSPALMKKLVDISATDSITTIFVQREYDTRNARAIAAETGARLVIIDPLAEDWYSSTSAVIDALHESFKR